MFFLLQYPLVFARWNQTLTDESIPTKSRGQQLCLALENYLCFLYRLYADTASVTGQTIAHIKAPMMTPKVLGLRSVHSYKKIEVNKK